MNKLYAIYNIEEKKYVSEPIRNFDDISKIVLKGNDILGYKKYEVQDVTYKMGEF